MQHIGLELRSESGELIDRLEVNFADAMKMFWELKLSDEEIKENYPFLGTIDPYGDTMFNVHQLVLVTNELKKFAQTSQGSPLHDVINKVVEFFRKSEQHEYVWFIGD